MKKSLLIIAAAITALQPMVAQNAISDNSASTAIVVRDPSRQASTQLDAAIYNPAGTAFLSDGLQLSLSGVATFQNIKSSYNAQSWSDNNLLNVIPSLQVGYKKGNWAFSLSVANEGGYGQWSCDNGSNIVNPILANSGLFDDVNSQMQLSNLLMEILSGMGSLPPVNAKNEDIQELTATGLDADLYNISARIGAAYKVSSQFSVYLGAKINYVTHRTSFGSLNYIVRRPSTGEGWSATQYFSNIATDLQNGLENGNYDTETAETISKLVASYGEMSTDAAQLETLLTTDLVNSDRMSGWGVTPVIGLDYKLKNVNLGAKFEFGTHISTNNDYDHFTLPASLSLGADWAVLENLNLAIGGTLYLPVDNFYGNNAEGVESDCFGNVSISATWRPTKKWELSIGETYEYVRPLINQGFATDCMVPGMGQFKTSMGAAYNITPQLQATAGVSVTTAQSKYHLQNNVTINDAEPLIVQSTYEIKCPVVVAVGINYKF